MRTELAANWDTDIAILLGGIVAFLALFEVTEPKTTASLTLVILAALAASLHNDRSLRDRLIQTIGHLDEKLSIVSRAYSNPLPYDVGSARYRWNFDAKGEIAAISKRAQVRFVHNGVWSILTWHSEGTTVYEPCAFKHEQDGSSLPLQVFGDLKGLPKGRFGKLIALDHEYLQDNPLDFEYSYQSRGNFPGDREWLEIAIETFTADLTIEIFWPEDRLPHSVWQAEGKELQGLSVETSGARHCTVLELSNLAQDQKVVIEWTWLPLPEYK